MRVEEFIKKLDRDTLIALLIKIISEFSVIRHQISEMMKESNLE